MPSFEDLPLDIIIEILKSVPDLPTLLHLIHSSPAANSVFQQFAWRIFDTVKSYSPRQIQSLINTITHIRSNTLPFRNRRQLLMYHGVSPEPITPPPLRTTPVFVIRGILVTSCNIQHLGGQIIMQLINRSNRIKPSHIIEKRGNMSSSFVLYSMNMLYHARDEERKRRTIPYKPNCQGGPPSKVEEQRVFRALWQMQLSYELERAAREGHLFWSVDDIHKILCGSGSAMFWTEAAGFQMEQFDAVKTCLDGLYPNNNRAMLPLYNGKVKYNWPMAESADLEGAGFTGWQDGIRFLGQPSPGSRMARLAPYHHVSENVKHAWCYYGFALWDVRRLVVLGLINPPMGALFLELAGPEMYRSLDELTYTWVSIFM